MPKQLQFPNSLTVADCLDWYDASRLVAGSRCAHTERHRIRQFFKNRYGERAITDCDSSLLLSFILDRSALKSNWTKRRWAKTINAVFNAAVKARRIDFNPFAGVVIPEGPEGRDWTDQEFRAALRSAPPPLRRLIVFCRFSGARPGEARELLWSHIAEGVIVQEQHKTAHATGKPRRIHLNSVITKLLIWIGKRRWGAAHVFLNAKRRPWTTSALTKRLRAVRKRAGLPDDVKMHGCRHTFGTNAIINGVDLATLAELMGHTNIETTRRYVHLANKKAHLNYAMEKAIGRKG